MASYLEQVRQLETRKARASEDIQGSSSTSGGQRERSELSELSLASPGCRACLCETYSSQHGDKCETCDSGACNRCGGCLRASMVWRRAEIDALYADVPVAQLLERLQRGSRWLEKEDQGYWAGDDDRAEDELFSKMWALWSDLELALRNAHQYEGCIFGEGQQCPDDGVVECEACADHAEEELRA